VVCLPEANVSFLLVCEWLLPFGPCREEKIGSLVCAGYHESSSAAAQRAEQGEKSVAGRKQPEIGGWLCFPSVPPPAHQQRIAPDEVR